MKPIKEVEETLREIEKKNALIRDMEDNEEIVQTYNDEKLALTALENKLNRITNEVSDSIKDWKPNAFSHGKYDEYKENYVKILRKPTTTRIVDVEACVDKYPLHVKAMIDSKKIKIPVTVIEKELKPEELEEIITRKTTYSYEASLLTSPAKRATLTSKPKKEKKTKVAA
jgi:hypothetical protein